MQNKCATCNEAEDESFNFDIICFICEENFCEDSIWENGLEYFCGYVIHDMRFIHGVAGVCSNCAKGHEDLFERAPEDDYEDPFFFVKEGREKDYVDFSSKFKIANEDEEYFTYEEDDFSFLEKKSYM